MPEKKTPEILIMHVVLSRLDLATLAIVDPETTALCQPNRVGEIWIDSPSIAFGFWELPKHSQSIFHALPLIVPVDTMVPEVYDPVPAGFLRTGLLGGLIEGRVVIFGLYEDRIQQEIVDLVHPEIVEFDNHYTADLSNTVLDRIVGFTAWYVLLSLGVATFACQCCDSYSNTFVLVAI